MFHQKPARPWYAMGIALAVAATPLAAQQGSAAPKVPAPATAPAPAADSAKQPAHKSRFGRFGRAFERAASTAAAAGAKAGLTKETAARLAVTAATGGAAAALIGAGQQSALSAGTLASRALAAPSPAPSTAASMAAARARLATGTVDTATASAAVRALTELGQISVRAQQHDPAAVHAMQVLNAAMAKPDAGFVALQQRATAGDPSAAQQIIIREDAIAHAALGGGKP